jgi:hypothetical protein
VIGKDLGLFEAGVERIVDIDFKKVYVNMRFLKDYYYSSVCA